MGVGCWAILCLGALSQVLFVRVWGFWGWGGIGGEIEDGPFFLRHVDVCLGVGVGMLVD